MNNDARPDDSNEVWNVKIDAEAAIYGWDAVLSKRLSNIGVRHLLKVKQHMISEANKVIALAEARLASHSDEQEAIETEEFYRKQEQDNEEYFKQQKQLQSAQITPPLKPYSSRTLRDSQ